MTIMMTMQEYSSILKGLVEFVGFTRDGGGNRYYYVSQIDEKGKRVLLAIPVQSSVTLSLTKYGLNQLISLTVKYIKVWTEHFYSSVKKTDPKILL